MALRVENEATNTLHMAIAKNHFQKGGKGRKNPKCEFLRQNRIETTFVAVLLQGTSVVTLHALLKRCALRRAELGA